MAQPNVQEPEVTLELAIDHGLNKEEFEMIKRLILSGSVSGVVLSRPHKNDRRIDILQEANFPFIVHGRSSNSDNYAWYDVDSSKHQARERLGCQKLDQIAFVNPYR